MVIDYGNSNTNKNTTRNEALLKCNKAGGGGWVHPKKPLENAMKLRESQLLHHLKPAQIRLKRRGFFTAIQNLLTVALT